jgi:hypothetical protein
MHQAESNIQSAPLLAGVGFGGAVGAALELQGGEQLASSKVGPICGEPAQPSLKHYFSLSSQTSAVLIIVASVPS